MIAASPDIDETRQRDESRFPAPAYAETVLAPLFDDARTHYAGPFRRIDEAHGVMLAETGIVERSDIAAILSALRGIHDDLAKEAPTYSGEVEDFFFHIERALRRVVGVDVAGRLHTGRSRNDMDHTIYRLVLKARIDEAAALGRALAKVGLGTARRERDTLIVAYTHGQPAQPSTFGHYLGAYVEGLLRDLERLAEARATVDLCPMGAAAITTTGFPIDRHRVADLLGFAAPLENAYGCIAGVDYITTTYSALKLMFLHLGRVVQDLQQWSGFETGQLYVPNAFVQISSIMPQKRNPVPIEHLRLLASLTVGHAEAMLGVVHNTPFTDMNDSEGGVHPSGYAAFDTAKRALTLMAALVPELRIASDRVRANIDATCITITELADSLVRREGLAFRQAHEIAAAVSQAVIAAKTSLSDGGYGPFENAFREATGRDTAITAPDFAEIVSPEYFVAVRDRFGGPAPAALDAAFDRYQERLDRLERAATETTARETKAGLMLADAVDALLATQGAE